MSTPNTGWSPEELAKLPIKSPNKTFADLAIVLSPPSNPKVRHALIYLNLIAVLGIVASAWLVTDVKFPIMGILFALIFTSLLILWAWQKQPPPTKKSVST